MSELGMLCIDPASWSQTDQISAAVKRNTHQLWLHHPRCWPPNYQLPIFSVRGSCLCFHALGKVAVMYVMCVCVCAGVTSADEPLTSRSHSSRSMQPHLPIFLSLPPPLTLPILCLLLFLHARLLPSILSLSLSLHCPLVQFFTFVLPFLLSFSVCNHNTASLIFFITSHTSHVSSYTYSALHWCGTSK